MRRHSRIASAAAATTAFSWPRQVWPAPADAGRPPGRAPRFSFHSPYRTAKVIRRRQSIARRTATARPVVDTDRTARTAGIQPFLAERSGGLHERSSQYRSGSSPGRRGSVP
jgi:hypothetical protein